jgi:NADH-quinone oxidoreductase subunit A
MILIAGGIAGGMLAIGEFMGPRRITRVKLEPFECGSTPIGPQRERFSVKFYLIAMLFLIFDVEIVFLYPWAVIFRDLGLFGLIEMTLFIGILAAALAYVWKRGALEWD